MWKRAMIVQLKTSSGYIRRGADGGKKKMKE